MQNRNVIIFAGIFALSAIAVCFGSVNTDRPALPEIEPLFDYPLRDVSICLGPDGTYYMTGTTGYPTWWKTNSGISIWKSADLKQWDPMGEVWNIDKDGTWQKKFVGDKRAVWAPEIHYIKGTYWLTYSMNYYGCGLLKSVSGNAEGPYVDVKKDGPLAGPNQIDASLFVEDDGTVYYLFQNGLIAKMNDDMNSLAEEPRLLKPSNHKEVGYEAAFIFKYKGKYHLLCADFNGGGKTYYDCMIASSDNLFGPYSERYLAIPHAGHNIIFMDKQGQLWSTIFGHDKFSPIRERPGILKIEIDSAGKIKPAI